MAGYGHSRSIRIGNDPASGESVSVDVTPVLGRYMVTFKSLVLTRDGDWISDDRGSNDDVLWDTQNEALAAASRTLR